MSTYNRVSIFLSFLVDLCVFFVMGHYSKDYDFNFGVSTLVGVLFYLFSRLVAYIDKDVHGL